MNFFETITKLVKENGNDADLGEKVRDLISHSKEKKEKNNEHYSIREMTGKYIQLPLSKIL